MLLPVLPHGSSLDDPQPSPDTAAVCSFDDESFGFRVRVPVEGADSAEGAAAMTAFVDAAVLNSAFESKAPPNADQPSLAT